MTMRFSSKARTLLELTGRLRNAAVPPMELVPLSRWRFRRKDVLEAIANRGWGRMAVRSSAAQEDNAAASMAGAFRTMLDVPLENLSEAMDAVASSMDGYDGEHELFIQPMIGEVALAGVAFTCDPNSGGPYDVINYEEGGRTDAVTSGAEACLSTRFVHHGTPRVPPDLAGIVAMLRELEGFFPGIPLDVEFAVQQDGAVVLLQVRPLLVRVARAVCPEHGVWLEDVARKVAAGQTQHPFLFGRRTVYGIMPDWNPAEIIGVRPRPLSLSLYKDLVTDAIWAYQRDNYGYRNLRSFPLLQSFQGLPYIDVRVSFNSFLPKTLPDDLAGRLVDHYISELLDKPAQHDKVEFDILFTCYTFDLAERLRRLTDHGFDADDLECLTAALRRLTHGVIHPKQGLWRQDRAKLDVLAERRTTILGSALAPAEKIYWLLEDCKRYGTLPFAGLARAGFIAAQILRSLVNVGALTEDERDDFMHSLDTVSGHMGRDFRRLSRDAFLDQYGHLRPGTYDITSPRYDEAPDLYFNWDDPADREPKPQKAFCLSLEKLRTIETLLKEHGLPESSLDLFDFLKAAIEGREYAKFLFSRNLSDALQLLVRWGEGLGFDRESLSYMDINLIGRLVGGTDDPREAIAQSIDAGRRSYARTRSIVLPPLLTEPGEVWSFSLPAADPNFITQHRVSAATTTLEAGRDALRDRIVLIPAADPGYDWLFTCGIAGFITMYGGINSHMAIRAQELGLPAVIGCGQSLHDQWQRAKRLTIDCASRQVSVLA